MGLWVRTLAALTEDLGSIPRTLVREYPLLFSGFMGTIERWYIDLHTDKTNVHVK